MTRHQPVNAAFMAAFAEKFPDGKVPEALGWGLFMAIGAPYQQVPDAAEFPILGFHITANEAQVLVYLLTPGRFIRYEVAADSRYLTVAVPVHRISRVVDSGTATSLTVGIELDADAVMVQGEYREGADPSDASVLAGRSVARYAPTVYEILATNPADVGPLMEFSIALRSTIGV